MAAAALTAAIERLPAAGHLNDPEGNHGVGFQIVHFAELAVVSPVFYWMWGSVLADIHQVKAQWENPVAFKDGVREVMGCVWELQIVSFETQCWRDSMLSDTGVPEDNLALYLNNSFTAGAA